jgi:hypothetical protein
MAKFKHGFPVSSAVMVGFLSKNSKAERQELIRLATAMVFSEELGQDINHMAQAYGANLELARSFQLPQQLDAPTVWTWRFEGMQIIRDAARWALNGIEKESQYDMGRVQRARFAGKSSLAIRAFESKLKNEQKLAEDVIRRGLTK